MGLLLLAWVDPAAADSVTDTISISIGYFGWEEDQYVEKAVYHWRDLDDQFGGVLDTHEVIYSYSNGSRTYLAAARGFYIWDLITYAGIDFGSIAKIDFFTKDQTVGAYRSFTKTSLFDAPRYYFPNLYMNENTGQLCPYRGNDFFEGAVRVEPILALEDYTVWDSAGFLFENQYDRSLFSAASRFHLFFGQLDPSEANTSSAAKYVYKLFITFSGTPVLSATETNIDLKVGSEFRMTMNIAAEDDVFVNYISENLNWSSSNDSIVSVDHFGNLTAKGSGEAVISASFGESLLSYAVRVNGSEEGAQREGAGLASSSIYLISPSLVAQAENAEYANSILNHPYVANSGKGALNNARREPMDADAQQLVLLARQKKDYSLVVILITAFFFTSGFGFGVFRFRRNI